MTTPHHRSVFRPSGTSQHICIWKFQVARVSLVKELYSETTFLPLTKTETPQRKPQLINAKSNQLWGNQLQLTHDTMQPLYLREHLGRGDERARGPGHLLWASVFYMQQGSCIHEVSTIWLPCLRPEQRQYQLKCQREWGRSHGALPLHEELLAINGYWVFPSEESLPGYLIPSRS